ncbi:MAG: PIN domain-containing protein [Deltaproteobacteria bacterium]|nr:PIN domain-containing protein [Deltaproteobacteria bacterium]
MADFVLDTHACVYCLAAPHKLGPAARAAMESVEQGHGIAWVPAAVAAEVILLKELGRIGIGLPELREAMEASACFRFLPLDLHQLDDFAAHRSTRDPFDRFILSAARTIGAKLLTKDRALVESGLVQTVWK